MLEPPAGVTDPEVLEVVRDAWDPTIDAVEHLPVGFGAHHWRAGASGVPRWFVTLDSPGDRRTRQSLESAYAAAAFLAADGLALVHPCARARDGRLTVPLPDGLLSLTGWLDGPRVGDGPPPDGDSALTTAGMLGRLHSAAPPPGLERWAPVVDSALSEDLAARTARPWTEGPHGEPARRALRERLAAVADWTETHRRLAREALERTWVPTHGEPHTRNQMLTSTGTLLVDWESLRLAPPERDLRVLTGSGHGHLVAADPAMLLLFDLEWRLDEISQYADWFEAPHDDGPDSRTALGGLLHELRG